MEGRGGGVGEGGGKHIDTHFFTRGQTRSICICPILSSQKSSEPLRNAEVFPATMWISGWTGIPYGCK